MISDPLHLYHPTKPRFMKEKVLAKEQEIKQQLDLLRTHLNNGHKRFQENPNDISYYPSLVYTTNKLKELLEFFNTSKP